MERTGKPHELVWDQFLRQIIWQLHQHLVSETEWRKKASSNQQLCS